VQDPGETIQLRIAVVRHAVARTRPDRGVITLAGMAARVPGIGKQADDSVREWAGRLRFQGHVVRRTRATRKRIQHHDVGFVCRGFELHDRIRRQPGHVGERSIDVKLAGQREIGFRRERGDPIGIQDLHPWPFPERLFELREDLKTLRGGAARRQDSQHRPIRNARPLAGEFLQRAHAARRPQNLGPRQLGVIG